MKKYPAGGLLSIELALELYVSKLQGGEYLARAVKCGKCVGVGVSSNETAALIEALVKAEG